MMKFKMKLTKKQWIIIGSAATAAVLLTVILCAALLPNRTPQTPTENEADTENTVSVSDISIEDPEKTDEPTDDTANDTADDTEGSDGDATAEKIPDGANVLTPDEKVENGSESEQNGEKPATAEQPVTPSPLPDEGSSGGGVVIGGGEQPKPYSCGTDGHHCSGPETHAYILNLELAGCEHCGSHNCPSFYATDEWGNTCYTPSKCPKYDIKKDPVYYCQDCGKECGSGSPNKCIQFVNSDNCPTCGEWVEGWTCHSCK